MYPCCLTFRNISTQSDILRSCRSLWKMTTTSKGEKNPIFHPGQFYITNGCLNMFGNEILINQSVNLSLFFPSLGCLRRLSLAPAHHEQMPLKRILWVGFCLEWLDPILRSSIGLIFVKMSGLNIEKKTKNNCSLFDDTMTCFFPLCSYLQVRRRLRLPSAVVNVRRQTKDPKSLPPRPRLETSCRTDTGSATAWATSQWSILK